MAKQTSEFSCYPAAVVLSQHWELICTGGALQENKGTAENTGIMYLNVSALAEHKDALITFANEKDWVFGGEPSSLRHQGRVVRMEYLDRHCFTQLTARAACNVPL